MSFMDCIPEANLPSVLAQVKQHSKRGLHGIDMEGEATPDRPTVKPKEWLNLGCGHTQFLRGWQNIDKEDFAQFAQSQNTIFVKHDVKSGLVQNTGTVDLIFISHLLEHLSYEEALRLLRECRRVLKPTGAMRIVVTDAEKAMKSYLDRDNAPIRIEEMDELDNSLASVKSQTARLWELLALGRQSMYADVALVILCDQAGFEGHRSSFRKRGVNGSASSIVATNQILAETIETCGINLFVDAIPKTGFCHA